MKPVTHHVAPEARSDPLDRAPRANLAFDNADVITAVPVAIGSQAERGWMGMGGDGARGYGWCRLVWHSRRKASCSSLARGLLPYARRYALIRGYYAPRAGARAIEVVPETAGFLPRVA